MEFKYKDTVIKISKTDLSSLKSERVIKFDISSDELRIRNDCFSALDAANNSKLKSLIFTPLSYNTGESQFSLSAKIMAQEVFKHIKDAKTTLREITFVFTENTCFTAFKDNLSNYIKYITYKLSQGPFSTIDIIIELEAGIILIERSNPPFGWALPGGFLDYGESLEVAAIREAKEETGLLLYDLAQFHAYSEPDRDPRFHTVSTVFTAKAKGRPKASSDAKDIGIFSYEKIKGMQLAFDHNKIILDYFSSKK